MSVIGIDLGSTSAVVAVIRAGGIDIVVNEVSNRRTPTVVGFTEKLRTIGESGFTGRQRNTKNTVSAIKRLLGRKFKRDDPLFQAELTRSGGCNWVEMPDGSVGAEVSLRNKKHTFSMQQITAMLISHLRDTTESYTKTKASNVVLSVPAYYSDAQRRALMDACKMAGLLCLQVINELSAVALLYGFYREVEKMDTKVMFVDVGATDMGVAVAHFTSGQCQMLAYESDPSVGGWLIDDVLARYFAERFKEKTKCDLKGNGRAWQRLLDAVERVKKTLNENEVASINIECVMEDRDLNDKITKGDYLALLGESGVLDRVAGPIQRALKVAGLEASQLESVEWVGSGMRAVPFQEAVAKAVGRGLSSTMNAEESVAKGCSLACALVSPLIKLGKKYKLIDIQPSPVTLSWKNLGATTNDSNMETSLELFPRKQHFGKTKYVSISRKDSIPFEFTVHYNDQEELALLDVSEGVIARGKVSSIPSQSGNKDADVRLKIRIDTAGITHVTEVEVVEKKEVEVEVTLPSQSVGSGTASSASSSGESAGASAAGDAEGKKGPDTEMKDAEKVQKEPPKKFEKQIKTVFTKVPFEVTYKEQSPTDIESGIKQLQELAKEDRYVLDTLNTKNLLEAASLRARDLLGTTWEGYTTVAEEEKIRSLAEHIEDWLYNEGSDEVKETYEGKLKQLNGLTDPVGKRAHEWVSVPPALATLQQTLLSFRSEVNSGAEKYSHITKEELDKVLKKVEDAENWLNPLLLEHQKLTKTSEPVLNSSDLTQRNENVTKFCQAILSTPKPKPKEDKPKDDKPKEEPAATPKQDNTNTKPSDQQSSVDPETTATKTEPEVRKDPPTVNDNQTTERMDTDCS